MTWKACQERGLSRRERLTGEREEARRRGQEAGAMACRVRAQATRARGLSLGGGELRLKVPTHACVLASFGLVRPLRYSPCLFCAVCPVGFVCLASCTRAFECA